MSGPNDKPQEKNVFEDPKLYVVVGEEKFPKSGLETAFVDFPDDSNTSPGGNTSSKNEQTNNNFSALTVGGVVCTCNKVRVSRKTLPPECSCVGHTAPRCSCVGHTVRQGCQCAPVH